MGDATIGRWSCETADIIAVIEPGPQLEALARRVRGGTVPTDAVAGGLAHTGANDATAPSALISIPVASLRPDKPGMRSDILRALRHDESPAIVFSLTKIREIAVLVQREGELGRYRVVARGELTLAGRTRSIDMSAEVVQEAPERFRIAAAQTIRMTDFGITPPTAFFGFIRVDETVTVAFDLRLAAAGGRQPVEVAARNARTVSDLTRVVAE
jgi:polyisoprenoid-binding protein YceI